MTCIDSIALRSLWRSLWTFSWRSLFYGDHCGNRHLHLIKQIKHLPNNPLSWSDRQHNRGRDIKSRKSMRWFWKPSAPRTDQSRWEIGKMGEIYMTCIDSIALRSLWRSLRTFSWRSSFYEDHCGNRHLHLINQIKHLPNNPFRAATRLVATKVQACPQGNWIK